MKIESSATRLSISHIVAAIEETMSRKARKLEQELQEFLQHAKTGDRPSAGVLGRVAEYLVAQRGIESQEETC
jgi:hypothetical protein